MKSLFEQMGGTYSEIDGYLIPNLTIAQDSENFYYHIDGIIGLGDYIGECGESDKVLEMLLEHDVLLIQGNREERLIQSWNGDSPQMENSLQFQCGRLAGKQIKDSFYNTIMLLPMFVSMEMGLYKALFTHGTQHNISELVYPDNAQRMENILENMNEDVFASVSNESYFVDIYVV